MTDAASPDLIVCATDFTPEAASALEWALGFARREGGRLDLVHVLPEPTRDREALAADEATFEAARLHDARERLSQAAVEAARSAGIAVQSRLLLGDADVRHRRARARPPRAPDRDGGQRPPCRRSLGAGKCRRADRSIGERARGRRAPSRAGPGLVRAGASGNARPFRALVGLEGDDVPELVTFAAGLRRRDACDVTFLHLYWPIEEFERLGLRGARDPLAPDPEVVKNLEPKLRARVGALPGRGQVTVLVRPAWGDPAAICCSPSARTRTTC